MPIGVVTMTRFLGSSVISPGVWYISSMAMTKVGMEIPIVAMIIDAMPTSSQSEFGHESAEILFLVGRKKPDKEVAGVLVEFGDTLDAIRAQIKSLSTKRYQDYIREGYKTLDYVIMFIPNYGALQLAKTLVPGIFQEAYQQGVLLTTEETLMPFLRMIRVAWTNYEQARNQEKIIKAAQAMIDRVADFASAHAAMGAKLKAAQDRRCKEPEETASGDRLECHHCLGQGL